MLGFLLGSLFLPSDPTGNGAPGDGFLLILTSAAGSIVLGIGSALLAAKIWRRPSGRGF
jgi:hypothetical protein